MSEAAKVRFWIKELEKARGRAKQTWLRDFQENNTPEDVKLFKKYLWYCYEPSITYGVTSATIGVSPAWTHPLYSLESVWHLLEKLRSRELTGNAAAEAIGRLVLEMDVDTFDVFTSILDHDARAGIGVSTINAAFKGLISSFDVMLAAQYDANKIVFPAVVEPKYDGMRVVAIEQAHDEWVFYTRSGKTIDTINGHILSDLSVLAKAFNSGRETRQSLMFDGELMGKSFQETMQEARRKDSVFEEGNYHIFDWLPAPEFFDLGVRKESRLTYLDRRTKLASLFKDTQIKRSTHTILPTAYMVRSIEELEQIYNNVRDTGQEGLIIKNRAGRYRPSRHRDWMKMKAEETLDLPIIGIERGTGKYQNVMGAMIVSHKGVEVRVGTGFSDEDRETFWRMWHVDEKSLTSSLMEVSFQEVTPDGSLRHPRYVRLRNDKTTPESLWS